MNEAAAAGAGKYVYELVKSLILPSFNHPPPPPSPDRSLHHFSSSIIEQQSGNHFVDKMY
jgi:hypothetical protein